MYNFSDHKAVGSIRSDLKIRRIWQNDMLENRRQPISASAGNLFKISLKPFQIMTIEIEFKAGGL
jgi:hypothetical protein